MKLKNRSKWVSLGTATVMISLVMACSLFSNLDPTATPDVSPPITPVTPTPTKTSDIVPEVKASPVTSRCDGVSGELEIQVLVGPAEAVGLAPLAVGELPFFTVFDGAAYLVQGGGAISYLETLEEDWGTYTVSLDMEGTLDGECGGEPGSEALEITIEMSGEQMVEVRADGFQGDYPWSGTRELDLSFPLENGAISEGEGWAFVLHLSK